MNKVLKTWFIKVVNTKKDFFSEFLYLVARYKLFFDRKELQIERCLPFTFSAVELQTITINEKPCTHFREVCKALEYNAKTPNTANIIAQCSQENNIQKYQMIKLAGTNILVNWPNGWQRNNIFVSEDRMHELLVLSQQPKAKELADRMHGYQNNWV